MARPRKEQTGILFNAIDYFPNGEAQEEKQLNNPPLLRKITNGLTI